MQNENIFSRTKRKFSDIFSKLTGNTEEELHDDYIYGDEIEDYEEIEEMEEDPEEEYVERPEKTMHISRGMREQRGSYRMQIIKPRDEGAATDILILLKAKNAVVVNMEYLDKEMAKNILHYISGGIFALDGKIQKVSNAIFLAVPKGVEIATYERNNKQNFDFGIKPWERAN